MDLDRLIDRVDGKGRWLRQIKQIQIHASVGSAQPAEYPERPPSSEVIPKDLDLAIREALTKMSWFYLASSERFLKQNPEV